MPTPILATKLYLPQPRTKHISRLRLTTRLNDGLYRKLTLVSAPAGFGKTTLISEWLLGCERPTAWLSLDEGDNDPSRFFSYVIAAVRTIAPNAGVRLLELIQSPQPLPDDALLTALVSEISSLSERFVFVLDDYHVIETPSIHAALVFLLDHLPPQMHLVITSREDPNLPLARLRVRDQLTELRAADLRFTAAEASEFLQQVMDLDLLAEDVAALENRTEGWIAGLQLAALSMQGRDDIGQFVTAFAGDNRYIMDYLVEEVLKRQPERVRNFLLQTAILDRMTGSLCNAVTGQPDGKAQLEALERGNFFVVPLDDKRHWYRYHHLFADVLSAHLREEQPEQIATLHQRASMWYEQSGSVSDAIRHALSGRDFERAATLIERAVPAMQRNRQELLLLSWFRALPEEIFHTRPVLSIYCAGTLLQNGELNGVETRLRDAERWLDPTATTEERAAASAAEMVVVDEGDFRRLPSWVAIYRAGIAQAVGKTADTVQYARQALSLVLEDDHLLRGSAASLLGLAVWASGDLEAAYRSYADGMAHLQRAGNISDVVGGSLTLADMRIAQGRLRDAARICERALQLASEHSQPAMRGTADMYVGISELQLERGDTDAATQSLLRSQQQGEHTGFPQYPYRWRVAMARIRETEGDLDSALGLLREAEQLYVSDFHPDIRPVAAVKTRMWIGQGRLGEALDWARAQGLSTEDDLSYLREFEHITLVRLLLAQYKSDMPERSLHGATELLERLLQAAEASGRGRSVIEILVLQALAHQIQGDIPTALVPLERALLLAEPEGYVRMLVDEGPPMAALLEKAAKQGITPGYTRQLLSAFRKVEDRTPVKQALTEPLSERELDVLRLLGTDLNGPEIARELMVSLNTVRTHTQNIFSKLGVNNRRAAVHRAEELDLL